MKIKIKVTKEILEKTKNCSSNITKSCAIAYAVREIFPEAEVESLEIFPYPHTHLSIFLPKKAQSFIINFDRANSREREQMDELEFEVNLSQQIINRIGEGNLEEAKQIISQSKTLELC